MLLKSVLVQLKNCPPKLLNYEQNMNLAIVGSFRS